MGASTKQQKRSVRRQRIRSRVFGTAVRPRLTIFKSNKYIYAQLIDDEKRETLASADSRDMKQMSMNEQAEAVGKKIGEVAQKAGITKAVFDRSGYIYTGRVKRLADAARSAGLDF